MAGCSSIAQKGGELLEGNAFSEMELALYRSTGEKKGARAEIKELRQKDGRVVYEISSSEWPGLAFRGRPPGGSGSFDLFEARILSSHVQGWNEFSLDIAGKAVFDNPKKTGGTLLTGETVERIQISSGRIRLKNSRITGARALTALRNRRERILALNEWMAGKVKETNAETVFTNQKVFNNFFKPLLFPELVSRRRRPAGYPPQNSQWKRADSIKWNLTYTENTFPPDLWEYRNSGAMLRDWEEAYPWIFMEYSWDHIISSINETRFIKVK